MHDTYHRNPLPVIVGFLVYQVSGWFGGEKIFESTNAEAMLFAFLLLATGVFGWIFFTTSSYDSSKSSINRKVGFGLIAACAALGLLLGLGTW